MSCLLSLVLANRSVDERASWTLIIGSLEEKFRKKEISDEDANKKNQPEEIDESQELINGFFRHKSGCQLGGRRGCILLLLQPASERDQNQYSPPV